MANHAFVKITDTNNEKEYWVRPVLAAFLEDQNYTVLFQCRDFPKLKQVKELTHCDLLEGGFINIVTYQTGAVYILHSHSKTTPPQLFKVVHNFKTHN